MIRAVTLLAVLLVLVGCESDDRGRVPLRPPLDPEAAALIRQANQAVDELRFDTAIERLDRLDKEFPGLLESSMTWGRVYLGAGQLAMADSAFRRVLDTRPDETGIHRNLGNVAFSGKQYQRALVHYWTEAEHHPDARPYHAMGLVYERLGEADSALWAFGQAILIDSTFAEAYVSLARWYETSGQFNRAAESATRASTLSPRNAGFTSLKGKMLIRSGRYRDGVEVLTPVVYNDPLEYRAAFALGRGWQMLGNEERARQYIDQAERARQVMKDIEAQMALLDDVPGNVQVRLDLAEMFRKAGRLDQSIMHYQIIEAHRPTNIGIKANLATLYLMRGDTTSAMARYNLILEQDSTVVEVWINLCKLYVRTGRREKAIDALAKAREYGKGNPRVQALEEWAAPFLQ